MSNTNVYSQKKSKKNSVSFDKVLHESVEYREIGPFRGGRSGAVVGVPGNPQLFYFGATGGGVWKTEDGGETYENISDGFFGGSIGSIAIAKNDPNVIYVGGGEVTIRGNVSSGYGIFKSVDAGKTWNYSGLPNSRHIPRIVIDPNNNDIVYAAVLGNIYKPTADRGVYKSIDGGASWKKVLYANNLSGAFEIVLDPINPRVLYASTWRVQRTPSSLSSGGEGSDLWKSTDYGENWTKISVNSGFPSGILGVIGVTVSPVNSERVWAIVENQEKGGVYRSDDGGKNWTYTNSSRSLRQRAWYYSKIYADTQDVDGVYVMNVSYHYSDDGGKTFKSSNAPHGDHHDLWIAPEDNNRLIIGDDGGAQVSYDRGQTWSTYYNQPTAQYYRVTTDNSFPYKIYVAQQDNSTQRVSHRSLGYSIGDDDWESTAGGESGHIAIDPNNNDIVYGGSYLGFLERRNHEKQTSRVINVWPITTLGEGAEATKYRFNWNFPIAFSKHDSSKLYAFSNQVHVSNNEGKSWKTISPDLTRDDKSQLVSSGGPITQDNTGVEYYATIFAVDESPIQEGLIWVGSDDGLIHLTKDGGQTWENVTPKKLPDWLMINSIDASSFDKGTAYVAGTRYKLGDFTPYLYVTEDYGKSWDLITSGIEKEHFTRVLRSDKSNKNILYAGTETGMYISYDKGNSWNKFQKNLPIVPITDLTIKDNSLIVATQGRSIWMIDDLTVIHQLSASIDKEKLYKPKNSFRMRGAGGRKSLTAGTNLPNGVIVHYFLPAFDKDDEIKLSFHSEDGSLIKEFSNKSKDNSIKVKKGGNSFVWNMKYPGAKRLDKMVLWGADFSGAKAIPGDYVVKLKVNDTELTQEFTILKNPTSEGTIDDIKSQFEFVNEINSAVDKAHKAIEKIREIKSDLNKFQSDYADDESAKNLIERSKTILESIDKIENELYQTKNQSNQDPLNYGVKLTNNLGNLNSAFRGGDFGPTDQDIQVKNELIKKVNLQLDKYNSIISKEIPNFNSSFKKLELDYLNVL
ncbi:MAG: glycosyl hydrolase [Flavobacteriaceae bacterium]|nr:glycosyl hydrolase [Flavobacteriaceae bacterium]